MEYDGIFSEQTYIILIHLDISAFRHDSNADRGFIFHKIKRKQPRNERTNERKANQCRKKP